MYQYRYAYGVYFFICVRDCVKDYLSCYYLLDTDEKTEKSIKKMGKYVEIVLNGDLEACFHGVNRYENKLFSQ